MKKVELLKGRSYMGNGIKAVRGKVLLVDDEKAKGLLQTGLFRISDVSVQGVENEPEKWNREEALQSLSDLSSASFKRMNFERMKTAELEAFASKHEIDISGCRNNAERIELIKAIISNEDEKKPEENMLNMDEKPNDSNEMINFNE